MLNGIESRQIKGLSKSLDCDRFAQVPLSIALCDIERLFCVNHCGDLKRERIHFFDRVDVEVESQLRNGHGVVQISPPGPVVQSVQSGD